MGTSTLHNVRPPTSEPRPLLWRRLGTLLLVGVVVAGVLGLLGDRLAVSTASEAGYTLTLEYARTARAGLDVPWSLTVEREGGFDGPELTVAVTGDYFGVFESQGLDPEPSAETADGEYVYWTFDTPEGDTFRVDFDAYVQPSSQVGASGTVAVVVDGRHVAPIAFTTTLLP